MKFKRLLAVYLVIIISFMLPVNGLRTSHAAKPSVNAKSYVVMDAGSADILYKKNANKKIYPASTAKIMTAMVAIDSLDLDKKITYTTKMAKAVASPDIAKLSIPVGSKYTVREYLYMMLMVSDASSASALAIGTSGSFEAFSKKMNAKAKKLGMTASYFDNPVGLDKGNGYNKIKTTARDYAIMARKAMSYQTIRTVAKTKTHKVPKCNKKPALNIVNTNLFYSSYNYDKDNYQVIGLKTGSTNAAGFTMIVVGRDYDNHEVICAYFGANSNYNRYIGIKKLMNYTFKRYKAGKITLHKDFWDSRYGTCAATIRLYADKGILKCNSSGRFYPNEDVTGAQFTSYLNDISGAAITFSNTNVKLGEFLKAYNKHYNSKRTLEDLLSAEILPSDMVLNDELNITKGQAVYIAANLKKVEDEAPVVSSDASANASANALTKASLDDREYITEIVSANALDDNEEIEDVGIE